MLQRRQFIIAARDAAINCAALPFLSYQMQATRFVSKGTSIAELANADRSTA